MKRLAPVILIIVFSFYTKNEIDYSFETPDAESVFGTKENPAARLAYEYQLLANPATGEVPENIRKRELTFQKQLLSQPAYLKQANLRQAQTEWSLSGPFNVGGRTRGADIDIRDEDVIIAAGVSGGIWKTTEGGRSWYRTTHPEIHNGVSYLIQDKRAGKQNNWYASTGEQVGNSARGVNAPYRGNGILKSSDNGETWTFLESTQTEDPTVFNSQFQYTWNLLINQKKTDITELWVASYGGILRSQDGGTTWEAMLGKALYDLPEQTDINASTDPSYTHIHQNENGHFLASMSSSSSTGDNYTQAGFYFSSDGENWFQITPPGLPVYHERTVIASGKSDPNTIYFLTHGGENDSGQEINLLWKYTYAVNGIEPSGSWQNLSDNLPYHGGDTGDFEVQTGGYNMLLAVHPEYENIVFLGGTNLYRSSEGFRSDNNTKWIGGYRSNGSSSQYPSHHADQHLLLFYPSDASKVLSCHDGGLSVSNSILNDSVIYTSINNGYVTSQFYTIKQQQDQISDIMVGGMQDNGSYIRESFGENPSWARLILGDGAYQEIAPNKNFLYVGLQQGLIFRISVDSENNLTGFARVDPAGAGEQSGQEYLFITPFMLDPLNGNKMYLAGGDRIWKNRNLAQIPNGSQNKTSIGWDDLRDTRINEGIFSALDKANDVLYAAAYRQNPMIFKIENASSDGDEVVTKFTPSEFPEFGYISCVTADPEDPDFVLTTFSNYGVPSIFLSENGCDSFIDVSGNLEENPDGSGDGPSVRWVEIVHTQSGKEYFVGTSIGLYKTDLLDGTNTLWVKQAEETIGSSVVTMIDYRGLDGRIVVATHGNGVFHSSIENPRSINSEIEADFKASQNYPNPFNDETLIEFSIPEDGEVRIDIFDSQGQIVKNLLWGTQYTGENSVTWDGKNSYGSYVRNGIYYYHLSYKGKTKTKRMVYIN